MLIEERVLILLGSILLSSEGRSIGDATAVNFPNHGNNYQDYGEQQEYAEQQGEIGRQGRDIQENGMESYQPQTETVRDIRDGAAEEVGLNVGDAAYQSRVNGDDDVEQQPLNSEVGLDRRTDERGVKKDVETVDSDANEQRDMAEQRDAAEPRDLVEQQDEGLRQNPIIEQAEVAGGGDAANFRPPRDNGANQALKEVARTEMVQGNPGDVGYEGAHGKAAGRSNNEATYNGAEQERTYNNYNYVQDPEGAGEGSEPQQGVAANEENMGVLPAQYEQAVN